MVDILHWPAAVLPAQSTPFNPRPFSRGGGRTLGGISRSKRTDLGYWVGSYNSIVFRRDRYEQRRTWNAIRTALGGATGLVAVPVCASRDWVAPGFTDFAQGLTPHSDDTAFDDGSEYSQGTIVLEMASFAPLGATVVTLRLIHAPTASGIRFSYQHAMYETGLVLGTPSPGVFQVHIFPAIRRAVPQGALLEADRPTVLCHLASDSEMDVEFPVNGGARPSVNFVEAVDYWNDLALGRVG